MKSVIILHWDTEYDVRTDSTLSDSSCKLFLEELLAGVRKGLERSRQNSSSSQTSSQQPPPLGSSTPLRHERERTKSMDDDMRFVREIKICV